jgi:hypothetical protein
MRHALQAVINIQTRHHHEEAISVDGTHERGDYERVPGFVGVVVQRVSSVGEEKGDGDHVEVFEGYGVVFFCFFFGFRELLLIFEGDAVGDDGVGGGTDADVYYGGYFPEFEEDAHSLAEEDHPAYGLLVGEI